MTLKELDEIKQQFTIYITQKESYRRSNTKEISSLLNRLNNLSFEKRSHLVNNPIDFEKCTELKRSFKTSILSMACLRNDIKLTEFLIKHCGANTETVVSLDEYELWDNITFYTAVSQIDENKYSSLFSIKAPVLWHCCRGSNLAIIRILVENGADINSKAESILNSTPLMVACAKNRLDVVEYLVEKGANVHEKNSYNENCLFYAVRHNEHSSKLISYLISLGVDMNLKNKFNKTVLNLSTELYNSNIMGYFMEKNHRRFDRDSVEIALMCVAVSGDVSKFKSLYDYGNIDYYVKIDALETIGVRLTASSDEICYANTFWDLSLDLRNKHGISKQVRSFENGFLPEFTTISELNKICYDPIQLQLQCAIIIDRILLKYHKYHTSLCKYIVYDRLTSGSYETFRNNVDNFEKCRILWYYTISLQMSYLRPLDPYLFENMYDFANYLITLPSTICTKYQKEYSITLLDLFKACLHEIKRVSQMICQKYLFKNTDLSSYLKLLNSIDYSNIFKYKLSSRHIKYDLDDKYEMEYLKTYFDLNVKLSVYLLSYIIKNLNIKFKYNQQQLDELRILTKMLNYFTLNLKNNKLRVLSLATKSNIASNFNLFMTNKFLVQSDTTLNYDFVKYLLDCGIDPDTVIDGESDKPSNNTFLNHGLFNDKYFDDISISDLFIKLFLNYGAHMDYLNDSNNTLANNYLDKYDKLLTFNHISLKCLASKSIKQLNINYSSHLPKDLAEFVRRH